MNKSIYLHQNTDIHIAIKRKTIKLKHTAGKKIELDLHTDHNINQNDNYKQLYFQQYWGEHFA